MRKKFTILLMFIATFGFLSAQNMTFNSMSASHPDTNICFVSQNQVKLLQATVTTGGGSSNPLLLEKAWFTYTGTNVSDISALRFFYANNTPLRLTDTLPGSIDNPGNSIEYTFPANSYLSVGDNHIWIGANLAVNAYPSNRIDLRLDSALIGGIRYTAGTAGNPAGNRLIVHPADYNLYCDVERTVAGNFAVGTVLIQFGPIFNQTATLAGGLLPNNTAVQFYPTPVATTFIGKTYPLSIRFGALNTQAATVFIDWNNDGYFTEDERVLNYPNFPEATTITGDITIPCTATAGYHRMRITSTLGNQALNACGVTTFGEVEDYLIYVPAEAIPQISFTPESEINYQNAPTILIPQSSIEGNLTYYWDYDNNGTWDDTTTGNTSYVFTTTGLKTIGMRAELQGCYQSFVTPKYTDTVRIVAAGTPVVNFISNINTTTPDIPVSFTDLSYNGVSSWAWAVFPSLTPDGDPSYTITPSHNARNPVIQFHYPGNYDIRLIGTNSIGSDTVLKDGYITVVNYLRMCIDKNTNLRSGYLYDQGGPTRIGTGGVWLGNYSNPVSGQEWTCSFLIKPKCAAAVTLDFMDLDICSYTISSCATLPPDNLKIFDGIDNSGKPLHLEEKDILGNPNFPNGYTNAPNNFVLDRMPASVTAVTGTMYLEFYVNCLAVGPGFELKWTTQTLIPPPPTAAIADIDTILYRLRPYKFKSASQGYELDYLWDFTGDGYTNAIEAEPTWVFTSLGTFDVRHIAQSCDLFDTAFIRVHVINPTSPPAVDFEADIVRATINDPVTITNKSDNTVYSNRWTISPATFTLLEGTTLNTENIKVKFDKTGLYTIKLVAQNAVGIDSVIKIDYISIYESCKPGVANLSADIGMAEVVLTNMAGDTLILNKSTIGQAAFTDYSLDMTADVYFTGAYNLTLKRNTNFNNITWSVYIDYNQDGFYDPAEKVAELKNSSAMSWTTPINIPNIGSGIYAGLSKMRIAANAGILDNKGCGPNYSGEFEEYGLLIQADNVPPRIILLDLDSTIGGDTVILNSCASWVDPGYIAWDDVNGDLTYKVIITGVSNINNTVGGYYPLTYTVTDDAGNQSIPVTRIVEVLPDIIPPTITINGNNPDRVPVFSAAYVDPGYSAIDDCSGMATDFASGTVNTAVIGEYIITYTAEDLAGNIATKERKVIVYDDVPPVITLNGTDTIYHDVKLEFIDPWVSIVDNYDTDLTAIRTGNFDINEIGQYFLSYCVTDNSGNGPSCIDRILIVQDTEAPKLEFEQTLYLVDVFKPFIEPAYVLEDNYWPTNNILVTKIGTVNTFKLGDYVLTYIATDASGNVAAPVQITVRVVDRVAPQIKLKGASIVTIMRWKNYVEEGYTATDNYYDASELILQPNTGTFENTLQIGLYTKTYQVCDPSGNCSETHTRFIYVTDNVSISENISETNFSLYPNPAINEVNLIIDMPVSEFVSISIYNTLGEKIADIHDGNIMKEKFTLNLENYSSGVYYIRFNVGEDKQFNNKLIITR